MKPLVRLALLCLMLRTIAAADDKANEVCAGCHDKGQKMAGTAHAGVACNQCHQKHEEYPHPAAVVKPDCISCHAQAGLDYKKSVHGQAIASGNQSAPECSTCHGSAHEVLQPHSASFRKSIPETCGMCHGPIWEIYKTSVHGAAVARGSLSAAVCSDCHGEHLILDKKNLASSVNVHNQRDTCGQCHGNVTLARRFGLPADRITTFDASFHGLAAKSGSQTMAGCASCHGVHNILPSSDPRSAVSTRNLPSTCGKCHPGAGTRFALGPIHVLEASQKEHPAIAWVRGFYLIVIPSTIVFMLLHNAGDWVRKLMRYYQVGPAPRATAATSELRMFGVERLTHGLLASSFIILAWTGLALKFPDAWWASPLMFGDPSMGVRRNIHRVAAVIMLGASVLHVISLCWSSRLRRHWLEMLPKWRDIPDALMGTAYNLGLKKSRGILPQHSYIEKIEYWAVVWGTAVMVVTGLLLWFNNWSLHFLPKWVLDISTLVHWYEAVLASLAILIWHFYSVIFDPDVYPMDTAWLTGRSPRNRESEHPPEHAEGVSPVELEHEVPATIGGKRG